MRQIVLLYYKSPLGTPTNCHITFRELRIRYTLTILISEVYSKSRLITTFRLIYLFIHHSISCLPVVGHLQCLIKKSSKPATLIFCTKQIIRCSVLQMKTSIRVTVLENGVPNACLNIAQYTASCMLNTHYITTPIPRSS